MEQRQHAQPTVVLTQRPNAPRLNGGCAQLRLGQNRAARMPIHHLLRLGRGAVIELDANEGDPLRIYANATLVALGEVRARGLKAVRSDR